MRLFGYQIGRRRMRDYDYDALRQEIATLSNAVRSMAPGSASRSNSWLPSAASYLPAAMVPSSWTTKSWTDSAMDRAGDARDYASQGADIVSRQFDHALNGAADQLRRRPLTAVVALLGIGVAMGLLARNASN